MFDDTASIGPLGRLVTILVGIAILTMGRKLFWLLVGTIGFIIGLILASQLLQELPDWVILVIALIVGIAGAVLAVFVQKIAVAIAGFVMGGLVLMWLLQLANIDLGQWQWVIAIIGGIIGMILATSLFEVALIALSALVGAIIIIQMGNFDPVVAAFLFLILILVGIVVQVKIWR